ncbi:10 kDa heat shock protein, mitochondrial-like [Dendronephthya gigantea]|uniref:10 kDa heat shock protein, mitochondrial-like n=1 Tax=Dendronephthya gigantea TaxID=151771 RepID=UPI00106C215E|nr:10 kDa heat shock protein, mitochondrial-like [Dendronephthya gigantea]
MVVEVLGSAAVIRNLRPLLDRIIVEKLSQQIMTTKGGVILPEQGLGKVLRGTVISAGPGNRDNSGNIIPVSVKEGDQVLLPEYGGTKIKLEDKEYHIYRDSEILGIFSE